MSRQGSARYRARRPWKRTYQPAYHPWLRSGSSLEAWAATELGVPRWQARRRIQSVLSQRLGYGRG